MDLRKIVTDLRERVDALPKIDLSRDDLMEQHRALRQAAEDLGQYLSACYGAKIAQRPNVSRIGMQKISATSTMGLVGALRNWITAAEKRLNEQRYNQ